MAICGDGVSTKCRVRPSETVHSRPRIRRRQFVRRMTPIVFPHRQPLDRLGRLPLLFLLQPLLIFILFRALSQLGFGRFFRLVVGDQDGSEGDHPEGPCPSQSPLVKGCLSGLQDGANGDTLD